MNQTAERWTGQQPEQGLTRVWSSGVFGAPDRQEAWAALLDSVYLGWSLQGRLDADFDAWCRHRGDPHFSVAECVCDPCAAERPRSRYGGDRDVFGIQLILSGRERLSIGDDEVDAGPGDVLLWDTAESLRFEVTERLHKLSVMLPLSRLHSWLPRPLRLLPRHFPQGSTGAQLLSTYLTAVSPAYLAGELPHPEGLSEAGIGLVVNLLGQPQPDSASTVRALQLRRIQAYINAQLGDPSLSPPLIASANRISLRYLHDLFDAAGLSVMQYLITQRLARCQRELSNPRMMRRKISDIALSCGFSNLTHFARRFRLQYGLSPQQYRAQCQAELAEETAAGVGGRRPTRVTARG